MLGVKIFAEEKALNQHLTIRWALFANENPWAKVVTSTSKLTSSMATKKVGPYIRVIDLGAERMTPHVHFLVGKETAKKIETIAKSKWHETHAVNIKRDPVSSVDNLAGYFFDRNFIPAHNDSKRLKGIRILSSSRGLRCGFPTYEQVQLLRKRLKKLAKDIQ